MASEARGKAAPMAGVLVGELASFELQFRASPGLVSPARRFVANFYLALFGNVEAASRIAVATHELLENATRYTADGEIRIRVEVASEPRLRRVSVETWNRAGARDLANARKLITEIGHAVDPSAYYRALMRQTAKVEERSGLGLARIRAESDMELACDFRDGMLCIRARTDVPDPAPVGAAP